MAKNPMDILNMSADVVEKKHQPKDFIKGAIKKPGQLHKDLDVPEGQKIPAEKLEDAAKEGGKVGQRARFAKTLEKLPK